MSKGKAKSRRQGHPAKVAERQGTQVKRPAAPPATKPRRAPKAPKPRAASPARRPTAGTGRLSQWSGSFRTKVGELWLSGRGRGGASTSSRRGSQNSAEIPGRLALAPIAALSTFSRRDWIWAGGSGLAAALLFATTITGRVGLGDAPETVAGVSSVGVLHAPGYPAYVAVAKLFTILVPFGSEAFRVNLFSLVCASLAVAGVALLARRCGAPRWAGAVAALCLASGTGFWYYATFAKHSMFSGLVFLIALHLALAWLQRPSRVRLVWLAVALAAGLGSSWPLMVLLLPAIAFVLVAGRRRLSLRALGMAAAAGFVVLVVVYGFAMVRAGTHPAVNWGDATNLTRLAQLVKRSDFTPHGAPPAAASPSAPAQGPSSSQGASPAAPGRSPLAPGPSGTPQGSGTPRGSGTPTPNGAVPGAGTITVAAAQSVTGSIGSYFAGFARQLGILGLLLACAGFAVSLLRRRTAATLPLLIVFVVNLIGAAALVGPGAGAGVEVDLIEEGFLLGCYFVLACWLAIGAGEAVELVGRVRWGSRLNFSDHRSAAIGVAAALLGLVLIVPPALGNRSGANRSAPPFADRYAAAVFSELPPQAAVVIWGAELTQPLIYRQVVDHQRRDVLVVAADGLSYDWYRQQLGRELHQALPARLGESVLDARRVTKWLSAIRPVYIDAYTGQLLVGVHAVEKGLGGSSFGYQPVGLLSRVVPGSGPATVASAAGLDQTVSQAVRRAGFPDSRWTGFPNSYVSTNIYSAAELEVARAYFQHRDLTGMRRSLVTDLSIAPTSAVARQDLQALDQSQGSG